MQRVVGCRCRCYDTCRRTFRGSVRDPSDPVNRLRRFPFGDRPGGAAEWSGIGAGAPWASDRLRMACSDGL